MDIEQKKRGVVEAFVEGTRPSQPSQQPRSGDARTSWSFWLEGSNNQINLVVPAPQRSEEDGALRRRLVAQALVHVRRIDAMEMFRSWMMRTYGSPLLSALTLPELRQAHREILSWRSAAG